jgi:rRNA maturation RNase YbeY
MAVNYYTEDCRFTLKGKTKTSLWIKETLRREGASAGDINIVFCSDDYLLKINREYLGHDYFTDIITFDYGEDTGGGRKISGDLMIGVGTVRENASKYGVPFDNELGRVMIHGVLHLLGYGDKTPAEEAQMRKLEDKYLKTRE